jgi:CubicO group peptidase (beta-lactamase class C family)
MKRFVLVSLLAVGALFVSAVWRACSHPSIRVQTFNSGSGAQRFSGTISFGSSSGPIGLAVPPGLGAIVMGGSPRPTRAELSEEEKRGLDERLLAVREKYGLPAMSAALVLGGKVVWADAVGVRKLGSSEPALPDDSFQIGSITKPLTATLLAVLVEKRIMRWDMTMGEVFPELADSILPEYRALTVTQHLAHLNGMSGVPADEGSDEYMRITPDLMGRRYEWVKASVKEAPVVPVGTFRYGGGTIMAAAMAERLTHTPYETLMKTYVFQPLGMEHCGFGNMSEADRVTGPWEHQWHPDGTIAPIDPIPGYDEMPHAPAGRNVHCSASDMARWMIALMPGTSPALLREETLRQLRAPVPGSPATGGGWFPMPLPWADGAGLTHNGDNGKNYADAAFAPLRQAAYIVMTNVSTKDKEKAAGEMAQELQRVISSK